MSKITTSEEIIRTHTYTVDTPFQATLRTGKPAPFRTVKVQHVKEQGKHWHTTVVFTNIGTMYQVLPELNRPVPTDLPEDVEKFLRLYGSTPEDTDA